MSKEIIRRNICPYYVQDDCTHPKHGILPGYKICSGNCYEEYEKETPIKHQIITFK